MTRSTKESLLSSLIFIFYFLLFAIMVSILRVLEKGWAVPATGAVPVKAKLGIRDVAEQIPALSGGRVSQPEIVCVHARRGGEELLAQGQALGRRQGSE